MNKSRKLKVYSYTTPHYTNHSNNKSSSPLINGKMKVVYGGTTGKPFCLGCGTELCKPEIERRKCMICKVYIALPDDYEKHATWDSLKTIEYAEK